MKRRSPGQGSRWSSDRDSSAGKFYGTGHAEGSSFPHRTEEGELIDHERRDESNVIDQCSNFDDATSRTIENAAEENRTSVLRGLIDSFGKYWNNFLIARYSFEPTDNRFCDHGNL